MGSLAKDSARIEQSLDAVQDGEDGIPAEEAACSILRERWCRAFDNGLGSGGHGSSLVHGSIARV